MENTFLVKYKSGKTLTETLDATDFPDAETYCQKRYGLSAKDAAEHGNTVTQVDATKPAKPAEPAEPGNPELSKLAAEAEVKAKK